MRNQLRGLDDLEMGDLWQRARSRTPRPDDDPDPRRSFRSRTGTYVLVAAVLALMVLIVATLLPLGDKHPAPASVGTSAYTDPSGWTANYPSDWTVTPIDQTSDGLGTGVTISNVAQLGALDTPSAVVLSVTHGLNAVPDASVGSSSFPLSVNNFKPMPGPSSIEELEFRVNGLRYSASLRVRPSASQADIAAMEATISSIRPVASSSASVLVPDLVGLPDQQALRKLDALDLRWIAAFRSVDGAEQWRVVVTDPAPGTAVVPGSIVRVVIATTVTPLPMGAADALSCPSAGRVAFGGPRSRITPGGSAYITGNVPGILAQDKVVQVRSTGNQWEGIWHVIRDGDVVAVLDFSSLDGEACAGSGVAGA